MEMIETAFSSNGLVSGQFLKIHRKVHDYDIFLLLNLVPLLKAHCKNKGG